MNSVFTIVMFDCQRVHHVTCMSGVVLSCSIMTWAMQLLEDADRPLRNIMRLPIACVVCSTNELDIAQPRDGLQSNSPAHE